MTEPTKAAAKRLVDEFNKNHETPAWRRAAGHAVHNDAPFGQVDAHLIVLGYDTSAYRSGAVAYLQVMAKTGNHNDAMRAASKAAGIKAPAEDLGPFDKLMDAAHERRDERDNRPRPQNSGTDSILTRIGKALKRRV